MKKIMITNPMVGICGMQVCVDKSATDEEILKVCNLENPAGTTGGWQTVVRNEKQSFMRRILDNEDEWEKRKKENKTDLPKTCADHKSRIHLIVLC